MSFGPWLGQSHCNGIFHNTSFIGFVAGYGDYQIEINISQCNGQGLQYGYMMRVIQLLDQYVKAILQQVPF